MYQIVKHYRDNAKLRRGFNELAESTFGLNFENWYQNGFWGDHYDPYSLLVDDQIVANVSVNRTDMLIDGAVRRFYQLGTVMTAEGHRNQGHIRAIMAEIERDISDSDGIYLFANDSVLDFYPKFGFAKATEYVFSRPVKQTGPCRMERVPMRDPIGWNILQSAMETNVFPTACEMVGNTGLIFFYVSQFMQDCVFYDKQLDAYVIAEQENGVLLIHNVFSPNPITLNDVIEAFGSGVQHVTLGFTPADAAGFDCGELKEDDCTFFVRGAGFQEFEKQKLRIPSLSHA